MAIAVESLGYGFKGVINYAVDKQHAQIIDSNMISALDPNATNNDYAREFIANASRRPRCKRCVAHYAFSPAEEDSMSIEELLDLSKEAMRRMGYESSQYLAVLHNDTDHPHIHIIVNRVDLNGDVVKDNSSRLRLGNIMRDLEQERGLRVLARPHQDAEEKASPRWMKEKEEDLHQTLKDHIKAAVANSENFTEYKAYLEAEGIDVSVKINVKNHLQISYKIDDYAVKGSAIGGSEKQLKEKRLVINEADKQLIREQQEVLADGSTRAEERSTDATEQARNGALERRDEASVERRVDGRDSDVSAVESAVEDRLDDRRSEGEPEFRSENRDFELEGDYKSIVSNFEEAFRHVEESERSAARISEHNSACRVLEQAHERAGAVGQSVASNLINKIAVSLGEDPVQISEGHEDEDAFAYFKRTEILFKKARAAAEKSFKSLITGEAIKPAASVAIHGAMFFIAKSLGIFNKPHINAIFRDINKADNPQTDQTKQSQASDKQANESSADIADIVQQIEEKREAKRKAEIQARRDIANQPKAAKRELTKRDQRLLNHIKLTSGLMPRDPHQHYQCLANALGSGATQSMIKSLHNTVERYNNNERHGIDDWTLADVMQELEEVRDQTYVEIFERNNPEFEVVVVNGETQIVPRDGGGGFDPSRDIDNDKDNERDNDTPTLSM